MTYLLPFWLPSLPPSSSCPFWKHQTCVPESKDSSAIVAACGHFDDPDERPSLFPSHVHFQEFSIPDPKEVLKPRVTPRPMLSCLLETRAWRGPGLCPLSPLLKALTLRTLGLGRAGRGGAGHCLFQAWPIVGTGDQGLWVSGSSLLHPCSIWWASHKRWAWERLINGPRGVRCVQKPACGSEEVGA